MRNRNCYISHSFLYIFTRSVKNPSTKRKKQDYRDIRFHTNRTCIFLQSKFYTKSVDGKDEDEKGQMVEIIGRNTAKNRATKIADTWPALEFETMARSRILRVPLCRGHFSTAVFSRC